MMRFRWLILLVAAAALFADAGCGTATNKAAVQPEMARDVAVVTAQRAPLADYVEAVGTVRAVQTAQLSSEIVATVREVRVKEGSRVRRGDVLLVLDDAQQRAGLERAQAGVRASQQDIAAVEAELGLASATLRRYQSLYEKKSVSPHEFEEVQARATAVKARRDAAQAGQSQAMAAEAQARAGLGYTRIRAPFDGTITAKNVDSGALASPGVPLLTIEDTRSFRLEASVDESGLRFVKLGAETPVAIDALGAELPSKVVQVVPSADAATRTFVVKLELAPYARVRSGVFGRARFARGQREAIVVPRAAVLDRGQMQGVYVIAADGQIGLRFVTLGKPAGDQVEVLSGLSDGERLVAAHNGRELAGKRIAN
ncbi:MAG: efflux RND transporter periplasmic adaptor subunit [Terriglobales bacterium]